MIPPVHVTSKNRSFILGISLHPAYVPADEHDQNVQFPEIETS